MELSAYRVVQEALTNVIKHAGSPTRVDVTCATCPGRWRSRSSTTAAARAAGSANGVRRSAATGCVGMRERVELWGGDLAVGPGAGGGYRVARHAARSGSTG